MYGSGHQTRGFLNIRDTIQCIELATRTPAAEGEMRVFNQFTQTFSVMQLAEEVVAAARHLGYNASCPGSTTRVWSSRSTTTTPRTPVCSTSG